MSQSVDELIADVLRASPDHVPGTRPIHAPGLAVKGTFRATDVARRYTSAEHFAGAPVPVTVRFSNGTGQPGVADADPTLIRGMAVKFELKGRDTDMVGMTLPVFFVQTVEMFGEFCLAATPTMVKPRPWWRKLVTMLQLRDEPADAAAGVLSAARGMYDFARHYPPAAETVVALGTLRAPESYSTCSYHLVHAFVLTAADGTKRAVRFHWEPVDGVRAAPDGTEGDYLHAALASRLQRGAVEFVLRMQVAEAGDDTADPTRAWSVARPRIVMGHLLLKTLVPADKAEKLLFNPNPGVAGIEMSDDPTLTVREAGYKRSFDLRCAGVPPAPSAPAEPART
ncbi:MAG: catalase, partial [Actinomycetota bacterium]|nr:catalase [Actinomycetota bacterium]